MPENPTVSGYVGTQLIQPTAGEATGQFGTDFRTNITTIASKLRYRNDDGSESQESVTAPTLLNSWANSGGSERAAGYYKDRSGRVHLMGSIKSGTLGVNAFVLASGYRPSATLRFAVMSNNAFGYVSVDSSGGVVVQVGSNVEVHLDGISFTTV